HAGQGGVPPIARLVAAADRVVCGDTGIAHLATALRTPSVVLFGPTSPALWGPPPHPPRHPPPCPRPRWSCSAPPPRPCGARRPTGPGTAPCGPAPAATPTASSPTPACWPSTPTRSPPPSPTPP